MDQPISNCRTLLPVAIHEGITGLPHGGGPTQIAAVVDVESTGLDPAVDEVIEIAVRRFRFDMSGRILKIDRGYEWKKQPSGPLEPKVIRLTGLTDADLIGQDIPAEAERLLASADFIIAHNAGFDRKFIDRLMPELKEATWLCSRFDIDWESAGFEGARLGYLLMQAGWFHGAHRALADVDAVITLLRLHRPDGRTFLSELVECGSQDRFLISAQGAKFAAKKRLKERGYRWNERDRTWETEATIDSAEAEKRWLMENIYVGPHMTTRDQPAVRKIARAERFA